VYDHRERCAIAGIGSTEFSRDSGRSVLTLAIEASLAAIADAGLRPIDIDGIIRCDMDDVRTSDLIHSLGLDEIAYIGENGPGGVAPSAMVGQAVGAILSGQASAVLVYRSLNGRSGRRYGASNRSADNLRVGGNSSYDEYWLPYGLLTPGQVFALMARRHMIEFGTTHEQLSHIPVACRERAQANPAAQMHGRPLTLEEAVDARMISDPLRLNDFCLETDGACALVVTTTERARHLPQPPALIRALAQGTLPDVQPGNWFSVLMRESLTTLPAAPTARRLFERAGMGPADIDVAQFYDCFSITVLLQLEDYGFCAKGEGGPFVAEGNVDIKGTIPINTAGGHLSEGYIHGMNHIVEGVRQVRGTSSNQVPEAETCLVTSTALPPGSALILRADA
jgi:acetyl-CoA acetyltransferase